MNVQVEVTWLTLQTIAHSIMLHAHVYDEYIHFVLIYMNDHVFHVLRIKHLVYQVGEPTFPHTNWQLAKKPLVSKLRVLFCLCVV